MKQTKLLKRAAMLALLPALLTACSSEEAEIVKTLADGSPVADGRCPIRVTATEEEAEATRAGTAIQSTNFTSGQTIKGYIQHYGNNGWLYDGITYTAGAVSSGKNPLTPDVMPYFPTNGDNVNIYAVYPSTMTRTSTTFTVQSSQTSNANYMSSDLMWAKVTNQAQTAEDVNLSFTHKMAKLIVKVTPASGSGITVSGLQLQKIKRTVGFTFSSGALGTLSNEGTIDMSNNGAVLFPPQTIGTSSTSQDFLKVTTNKGACYFALKGKAFASGKVYTMNITLSAGNVNTTALITDWGDDGSTVTVNALPIRVNYNQVQEGHLGMFMTSTGIITDVYDGTCIGIIVYVGGDTDITCGKGHGLVMALKNANNAIWGGYDFNEASPFAPNATNLDSELNNQKNGLTNTLYLVNGTCGHTDHNAAKNAYNYTSSSYGSWCTRWFLPSAAQAYAMIGGSGAGSAGIGGWQYDDLRYNSFHYDNASYYVLQALKKAGEGNYDTILSESTSGSYWTSSEYNANVALSIGCLCRDNANVSNGFAISHDRDKSTSLKVRPFLAF